MGRERQKKKDRSSVRKATLKPNGRTKTGKKKVNFLGNAIIAENWDRKLTLTQNYKLLGLSSRLNAPTGGSEQKPKRNENGETESVPPDAFSVPKSRKTTKLVPTETRVERDPETGRILRIIKSDGAADETVRRAQKNPLNDPLADLSDEDEFSESTDRPNAVVADLEAQVQEEAAALAKKRRPRQQSKREEDWIERLVDRYGDDIKAMARDLKLNPLQQSEGDLGRRVGKWKQRNQSSG